MYQQFTHNLLQDAVPGTPHTPAIQAELWRRGRQVWLLSKLNKAWAT